MLSPADTAIIFVVALLLFGPEQLPKIARQLGETMRNIQHTTHSFMNEMERAATLSEIEEARSGTAAPMTPALPDAEKSGASTDSKAGDEAKLGPPKAAADWPEESGA